MQILIEKLELSIHVFRVVIKLLAIYVKIKFFSKYFIQSPRVLSGI